MCDKDHKENHKFENTIRFAVGNVEEFICNFNFVNMFDVDESKWIDGKIISSKDFAELRDINDRYFATGIICLEEKEYILKMIDRLKEKVPIDGVEAFHSSFTIDEMIEIQEYAKKNKLYISGGSDYHGTVKPDIHLKTGCDNLHISKNILDWINEDDLW